MMSRSPPKSVQSRRPDGTEPTNQTPCRPKLEALAGSVWDSAIWDADVWGGSFVPEARLIGASGIGREVAIAVRGTSASRMTLTGIDVMYDMGGLR